PRSRRHGARTSTCSSTRLLSIWMGGPDLDCHERSVRTALTELETEYVARRGDLERQLEEAKTAASAVREDLLYGTGQRLADAGRSVFKWAGVTVADLDGQLGGTKNADLLCGYGSRSRLVEVKSASGNAPERLRRPDPPSP